MWFCTIAALLFGHVWYRAYTWRRYRRAAVALYGAEAQHCAAIFDCFCGDIVSNSRLSRCVPSLSTCPPKIHARSFQKNVCGTGSGKRIVYFGSFRALACFVLAPLTINELRPNTASRSDWPCVAEDTGRLLLWHVGYQEARVWPRLARRLL